MYIPLVSRRYDPFGVLEVVSEKPGEFSQRDIELLKTISNNIAISIERSNLYNDLRRAESVLRYQNAELRQAIKHKYRFDNIIGSSIFFSFVALAISGLQCGILAGYRFNFIWAILAGITEIKAQEIKKRKESLSVV